MESKRAEMGIGTLIIFIAMIFVAGVTASVFIQSASSLQSKALGTAKEARSSVSTGLMILHISADDGRDGKVENFEEEVKPLPGSDTVNLKDAIVSVVLKDDTVDLLFSDERCANVSDSSGDGYYTDAESGNGTFTLEYIQRGDDHVHGYLARGEMVKVCFSSPREIVEDEEIELRIVPKTGTVSTAGFVTPSVMTTKTVRLYP